MATGNGATATGTQQKAAAERNGKASAELKAAAERAARAAAPRTLDDLARLDDRALARLYREAVTPRVEDLAGPLVGRMLAVPAAEGLPVLPAALRLFAASFVFPWRGKTFRTTADGRGEGLNRVLFDRFSWFRFTTSVGRSRAGDFDAVQLDYDHPENPAIIRAIKDEIREVAPGLWLGRAYAKALGGIHMLLWFGLARRA